MSNRGFLLAAFVVVGTATQALAADPRYPDWPCAQAKVPEISLAAVWAGPPLDDVTNTWRADSKIDALVARLAARRTSMEDAGKLITDLLSNSKDKVQNGKMLFAGLFESLNAQRTAVMNGLERVTRKQRAAADKIRADTLALHELQDSPTPDPTKIEQFSDQLTWQTRIFEDRNKVIRFACEVPTIIDQRLFALGRTIQQEME